MSVFVIFVGFVGFLGMGHAGVSCRACEGGGSRRGAGWYTVKAHGV